MSKIKAFKILILLILAFILSSCLAVSAHPGGLDANGGHYNRKTGEYHYHTKNKSEDKDKDKPEAQTIEVYFHQNGMDKLIGRVMMYLYICATFYYILCTLYNSLNSKYLKFIFPPISLFLLMCAVSMSEDSARGRIYLPSIWLVVSVFISYGIYSIERNAKFLKKQGIRYRRTENGKKY